MVEETVRGGIGAVHAGAGFGGSKTGGYADVCAFHYAQFGQSMSIFHVFFMVSDDLSAIYSESRCSPDGIVQRTNM